MKRVLVTLALVACGSDGNNKNTCADPPGAFAVGDANGHADPLHAGPDQARAGRIHAADLPVVPSGLVTWKDGDFVLANDRVAIVIEDVGDSDLYDPWGGRPVGLARVAGGHLIEPANFGELFFLTGRSTIVTDSVTVLNDGSDGKPAIIRATGKLHPLPFFESVIAAVYHDELTDIDAAIDYELAPGSDKVDVRMRYASPRETETTIPSTLHAFMYTERMPAFQPVLGFDGSLSQAPYIAFVDDDATSWAYMPGDGALSMSLSVSGFLGAFSGGHSIPACGTTDRIHASIVIGGPGLDGIQAAVAGVRGEAQRTITGTVTRGGMPASGVRVHATDNGSYLTRVTTDADGHFSLNVPAGANVHLDAYKRGDAVGTAEVGAGSSATIDLPANGSIHVTASPAEPVRVQVLPAEGQAIPSVPDNFGEPEITGGRLHVAYAVTGDVTLTAPPGKWEVIVSRGYEYELVRQTVDVVANQTVEVDAPLDHVVDTTGIQCGDFHVHTWRSNDSGDDAITKVAQAVADGVELPVRSDHEWVADFSAEIAQLGVGAFAASIGSIELTSFEVWGHMGVIPLTPDPTQVNNGAPKWQTFPTADAPDTPFETLSPVKVFDAVRARPEHPLVIINHPHSGVNYFPYVGYDPATGTATATADWDTKFTLVEVFNDSSWKENRNGSVNDWLGMLKAGRKVFATGASDTHRIASSPVGYPRTCLALGTDDPRDITPNLVRDTLAAGHTTVSGGIYVTARLGTAGPGDTTTGAGSPQQVDVTIQAPTWIDVTGIEVIVDGETVDTIPVMPGDADPQNAAIRWQGQIPVSVRASGGFVIIAAYGDHDLDPVHPGRIPFGVTNPIFVEP
jgi:hypothetical protein